MWEVWTRRPRRLGTVLHWNFPGVRCSTGMSAVVEWRLQNSSFSWISAFQCFHQTSEINATRIFHPKDYLKSTFQNSKVICHLFQTPINITLQCIWYTLEQTQNFLKQMQPKFHELDKLTDITSLFTLLTKHSNFGFLQYLIFDWYVCLINLANYRPLFLDWF